MPSKQLSLQVLGGIILVGLIGYGVYFYYEEKLALQNELAETKANLASTTDSLTAKQKEFEDLTLLLGAEQNKNSEFESQIGQISSTVGTLKKLSETDKELLQKYSKIYFLNENYIPESLSSIDPTLLADPKRKLSFHTKALSFLEGMMTAAKNDGSHLLIASAYRSFDAQTALKSTYTVTYGSGANKFSADQGYSEHQLGTTVDFSTQTLKPEITGFEKTPEYKWLLANAYQYGFVLSYPKGNTYYQFEPWHFRFVGVKLATHLHDINKNFYDLDQREIDTYLVNIFD